MEWEFIRQVKTMPFLKKLYFLLGSSSVIAFLSFCVMYLWFVQYFQRYKIVRCWYFWISYCSTFSFWYVYGLFSAVEVCACWREEMLYPKTFASVIQMAAWWGSLWSMCIVGGVLRMCYCGYMRSIHVWNLWAILTVPLHITAKLWTIGCIKGALLCFSGFS